LYVTPMLRESAWNHMIEYHKVGNQRFFRLLFYYKAK
jgi:hypothetical protein